MSEYSSRVLFENCVKPSILHFIGNVWVVFAGGKSSERYLGKYKIKLWLNTGIDYLFKPNKSSLRSLDKCNYWCWTLWKWYWRKMQKIGKCRIRLLFLPGESIQSLTPSLSVLNACKKGSEVFLKMLFLKNGNNWINLSRGTCMKFPFQRLLPNTKISEISEIIE